MNSFYLECLKGGEVTLEQAMENVERAIKEFACDEALLTMLVSNTKENTFYLRIVFPDTPINLALAPHKRQQVERHIMNILLRTLKRLGSEIEVHESTDYGTMETLFSNTDPFLTIGQSVEDMVTWCTQKFTSLGSLFSQESARHTPDTVVRDTTPSPFLSFWGQSSVSSDLDKVGLECKR